MKAFEEYVQNDMDKVEGWCGSKEGVLFNKELELMRKHFGEPKLGVMEIGVHHAKYLIALHNLVGGKKSLGIDLFDDQDKNIDNSGAGNYNICIENINKYSSNPNNIELMPLDSLEIDLDLILKIKKKFGRFSYVSIDGGHEPNHVINDINVAVQLTHTSGFIILDDYYNHLFPGVSEGFSRWIINYPSFVPFAVTSKKLYLAHLSYHDKYIKYLSKRIPYSKYKVMRHFGYVCLGLRF